MPQCKVFIVEFMTIYRLSTSAIMVCEVTTLTHLSMRVKKTVSDYVLIIQQPQNKKLSYRIATV